MCQKIGPGPSAHPHLDKIQKKALFSKTCKFLTAAFSFVYEREIFPIKAERIQGVTLSPAGASGWTRESGQANYNMYGFYPHFLQPWVPEGALRVKSTWACRLELITFVTIIAN